MPDIIKTWPSFMTSRKIKEIFKHDFRFFWFSLGRGKPKKF